MWKELRLRFLFRREPRRLEQATGSAGPKVTASPYYALGQLSKALRASGHDDELNERALRKVEQWRRVLEGMLAGSLEIGSRTPIAGIPGWVTHTIVTGGFATGDLAAGGALCEHEEVLLARLDLPQDERGRAALNAYFLGDAGLSELRELLHDGCYRIGLPEEGALLVVAWLVDHGHVDRARNLLDALAPFFGRLRFYPIPSPRPFAAATQFHVQTIGRTIEDLAAIREPVQLLAQRETLAVWAPMFDGLVALLLETVSGDVPSLAIGADGRPLRRPDGSWPVAGGWPCQRFAADWSTRAEAWLEEHKRLRREHARCRRPERARGNYARLQGYLERLVADRKSLNGRDVGTIRMILAQIAGKRGLPHSGRCLALRKTQGRQAAQPTPQELARVVAERLRPLPDDAGLAALEPATAPVTEEEASRSGVPAGYAITPRLHRLLVRCLDAPLETLVESGAIPSGEVLARVVPQLSSQIVAARVADPDLRRLLAAIHQAFSRRRSFLLLNLESQIKIDELPWISAIPGARDTNAEARGVAHAMLRRVALLALIAFPDCLLPNRLLRELRALVDLAGLDLPLVDEVAADIFMGEFTEKYLRSAQRAGLLLGNSLYETYYGISYERLRRIDDLVRFGRQAKISPAFAALCVERAGVSPDSGRWSVARNGAIIEQQQILTTHNLAVLVDGLELTAVLEPHLLDLARHCFTRICRQLQNASPDWRPRLHSLKNNAYAWRQMLFFLSLAPRANLVGFLAWAEQHLCSQPAAFQNRFRPALSGLMIAARGGSLNTSRTGADARRFLGWATERHWLWS